MGKILFIVILLLLAYIFFKSWRRGGGGGGEEPRRPTDTRLPEDMVRCEICGVNLPRSEAFISRNRLYCSDEHLKLGSQRDA